MSNYKLGYPEMERQTVDQRIADRKTKTGFNSFIPIVHFNFELPISTTITEWRSVATGLPLRVIFQSTKTFSLLHPTISPNLPGPSQPKTQQHGVVQQVLFSVTGSRRWFFLSYRSLGLSHNFLRCSLTLSLFSVLQHHDGKF